jgi:predicted amidophosphoribosyltransferase
MTYINDYLPYIFLQTINIPEPMFKYSASSVQGYFLCHYIPAQKDTTPISNILLKFKNNEHKGIVSLFCKWASKELSKEGIPIQTIVRALHSYETEATSKTSLDKLGNELAKQLNARYNPRVLKKSRMTLPLKGIEFHKRVAEVHNIYYCVPLSEICSILIIDDIYTTGATTSEIVRAIKTTNPNAMIYMFTLGKSKVNI